MIIGYDLNTGGIVLTVDNETDINSVDTQEGQGKMVTLVEHGSGIRNLRVDLETKTLVPKSAIIFKPDKHEIAAGESVIVEFLYEGEQFGDHFPLRVNSETVLAVPYNEPQIELTLELPGEYVLSIPDPRVHSISQRIRVKESLQ
jgi:hypothetical protein